MNPSGFTVTVLQSHASRVFVLVGISLKSGNGIELIKRIRSRNPAIKMLVVSGFQESLYAERACRAGAMGYLNKQESCRKLMEAIRTGWRTILKPRHDKSPH